MDEVNYGAGIPQEFYNEELPGDSLQSKNCFNWAEINFKNPLKLIISKKILQ